MNIYPKILWTISFQKWGPYCHVKYWTISDECLRAEILGSEISLLMEYHLIINYFCKITVIFWRWTVTSETFSLWNYENFLHWYKNYSCTMLPELIGICIEHFSIVLLMEENLKLTSNWRVKWYTHQKWYFGISQLSDIAQKCFSTWHDRINLTF